MRKADKNKDNKMSFKELKNFLKEVNVQVDDSYARQIFQVRKILFAHVLAEFNAVLILWTG